MSSFLDAMGVSRGAKVKKTLEVGSDPLMPIKLPLWIIAGSVEGPILTVTAGVHGSEYASILAAISTFGDVGINDLKKGVLVIIPIVNPPAFSQRTSFVCPIDNVNLNRVFPGDANGSITSRIAYSLFSEILVHSDYVVDLHGGDLFERLLTHSRYFVSGRNDVDEKSRTLATLFTEKYYQAAESGQGNLFMETARAGVPSIIVEAGGEGFIEKRAYEFHKRGIVNTLKWLEMLPGEVEWASGYEKVVDQIAIRANRGGFLVRNVEVGDTVRKGQTIAEIIDASGKVAEKVLSPIDKGLVMLLNSRGGVNSGDTIFLLWLTTKQRSSK